MGGEVGITTFIDFVPRVDQSGANQVKKDIADLADSSKKVSSSTFKGDKAVSDQDNAYQKLNTSISSHLKQLEILKGLEGTTSQAQSHRSAIVRELTAASAAGIPLTQQQTQLLKEQSAAYGQVASAGNKNMMSIAQWAIGWTAMYGVIRGVQNLIKSTINDALDLEQQISRAITASRMEKGGGIPDIAQRAQLKQIYSEELLNYIRHSTAGFKESGEALYFLSTAGLTAKEALAAMPPVLDLTIAGFGSLDEISRMTATVYNKWGKDMVGFNSEQEKMTHIVDAVAYAYRNQQIELSEVDEALKNVAQAGGLVNFRFEDLIQTIGFLGTGALRGSRAGTTLSQTIIAAAKNSEKLKNELGIALDPNKPLDFVNLMEQLHQKLGDGKMTLSEITALFDVFNARGGRAVAEILSRFDEWKSVIGLTNKELEGTAKSMREIAEENTKANITKMFNAFKTGISEIILGTSAIQDLTRELANYFITVSEGMANIMKRGRAELALETAINNEFLNQGKGGFWQSIHTSMRTGKEEGATLLTLQDNISKSANGWKLSTEGVAKAQERVKELFAETLIKAGGLGFITNKQFQDIQKSAIEYGRVKQPILKPTKGDAPGEGIPGKVDGSAVKEANRGIIDGLKAGFAEVNAQMSAQQAILKAYGVEEDVLIQQHIDGIQAEIDKINDKIKANAKNKDVVRELNKELTDREKQLIIENGNLEAFYVTKGRKDQEDYYKWLFTSIDRETELKKLQYQIAGKTQRDMLGLEMEAADEKMHDLQTRLDSEEKLSEEDKKRISLEIESLKNTKEKLVLNEQLVDVKERQAEAEKEISFQEQIWKAMGLNEVEIAQKTLDLLTKTKGLDAERSKILIAEATQKLKIATLDQEREVREQKYGIALGWAEILQGGTLDSLKTKLDLAEKFGKTLNKENEEYLITLERQKEIGQLVSAVYGDINNGIVNLIEGTGTWGDLMNSINHTILQQSVEYLTKMTIGKGLTSLYENLFNKGASVVADSGEAIAATTAATIKTTAATAAALAETTAATASAGIMDAAGVALSAAEVAAATTSSGILIAAGATLAAEIVAAATTAAAIMTASSAASSAISYAAEGAVFKGGFTPIRQFGSGGVVNRPTLGLVGEGRYNEAVVPLPNGKAIPVEMKGGGESNKTVVVNLSVNAIDGQNTYSFLSKNKGMIASLIQAAMKDNHPLRRA